MERRWKGELWRERRIKFFSWEEEKLVKDRKKKPIRTFPSALTAFKEELWFIHL